MAFRSVKAFNVSKRILIHKQSPWSCFGSLLWSLLKPKKVLFFFWKIQNILFLSKKRDYLLIYQFFLKMLLRAAKKVIFFLFKFNFWDLLIKISLFLVLLSEKIFSWKIGYFLNALYSFILFWKNIKYS